MFDLFQRLKDANLTLSTEEYNFIRKNFWYLGHQISSAGVRLCPQKLKVVSQFFRPKTKENVKQALGLFPYYRKFISNFAGIAKPSTDLHKDHIKFFLRELENATFGALKDTLCNASIPEYTDLSRDSVVTCDAFDDAISAILSSGKIGED